MKTVFYYFLQLIACSSILYGYYHIALRNKKFHSYNRYYLMAVIFVSILLPLINIPIYFTISHEHASAILQTLTVISSHNNPATTVFNIAPNRQVFTTEQIVELGYWLITFAIFIRFLLAITHIYKLMGKYTVEKIDKIRFVNTEEPGTPFSFFKWLFWNKKINLQSENGEQLFRHELFHIQQKHSADVIFLEILTAVFWINPFFHLIKKEVKAIHEFLADEFAANEKNKWNYAELLLMQVLGSSRNRLVNPFFYNQIKRRIAMITSSQKASYQYLRKIMVLPVAAIAICLFAFKYKEIKSNTQLKEIHRDTKPETLREIGDPINVKSASTKKSTISLKEVFTKEENEVMIEIPQGMLTGKFDKKDTSKPMEGILFIINGKERPDLKSSSDIDRIIKPTDISSITVLKGPSAIAKYGEKGKNGALEFITKDYYSQCDTLKPIISLPGIDIRVNNVIIKDASFKRLVSPDLIIFNNKEYSTVDFYRMVGFGRIEAKFGIITPPNDLESIKKYGDRAKNGMMVFKEATIIYLEPEIKLADLKKATLTSLLKLPPDAKVINCLFTINTDNGGSLYSFNSGNDISANTVSLLQTAASGKILIIEDIDIEKDGTSKRIPSLFYIIN